jgi:hypothetical protein
VQPPVDVLVADPDLECRPKCWHELLELFLVEQPELEQRVTPLARDDAGDVRVGCREQDKSVVVADAGDVVRPRRLMPAHRFVDRP